MSKFNLRDEDTQLKIALVLGIFLIFFLPWSCMATWSETVLKVTSVEWSRNINIDRLNTHYGEGFGYPLSVFTQHTIIKSEIRGHWVRNSHEHTRTVHDSDGRTRTENYTTYTDDWEYDRYYFYKWDQWDRNRTIATCASDHTPFWGTFELQLKEREAGRTQVYTINMKDPKDNKLYDKALPESEWSKIKVGYTFRAALNFWGGLLEIRE